MDTDRAVHEELIDARDRGVAWILDHVSDDGEAVGSDRGNYYYRVPWALADAGERGAAAASLSWIEANALDRDGDLRPGAPSERHTHRWASYPLAIIAIAAWSLSHYDTANAIMDRLESDFQDPESGGALTLRPEVRGGSRRQDLFPTAQLGYTAVATGRRSMADAVYRWFQGLYGAQPELPHRLYTIWQDGLVTDGPEESRFDMVTDFQLPRQAFYNPGIAAAFLGRYAAASGSPEAFELAAKFLSLSESGGSAQFDYRESRQICKYGWGAAVMLESAPDGADYAPVVERMGSWFLNCQSPDGSWTNSPFISPRPTDEDRLEVTANFVLHLSTLSTALRSASSRLQHSLQ